MISTLTRQRNLLRNHLPSIYASFFITFILTCGSALASLGASISSFSPASGSVGTLVTVKGTGFISGTKLTIGGKTAIITSLTSTQIVGMVMPGAVSGLVIVNTSTKSKTNFTVTETPCPFYQQGAKLIDTTSKNGPLSLGQGKLCLLAADGNSALVNSGLGYLSYTRENNRWSASSTVISDFWHKAINNYAALNADGSTVLLGNDGGPVRLYKRNNGAWQDAGTLNDSLGNVVGLSADGKTAILGKSVPGGSYGGGETARGISIMKLVGNTWQTQQISPVPNKIETRSYIGMLRFDEHGNVINKPVYYKVGRWVPGNRVAISADGKTAAASSFQNAGRYNYIYNLGYTAIYKLSSTGWKVQAVLPEYRDLKFSADGNTFLAGSDVYTRSGDTWSLQQSLPFGRSSSMTADGNTIIIAAPLPTAYVRIGNSWIQKEMSAPSLAADATDDSRKNITISADGTTAFFGIPDDPTRVHTFSDWGVTHSEPFGSVTVYGNTPYDPLDYATTTSFTNITDTSTTFSWPRGDGTVNRAVFLKLGTAGLPKVVKGTSYAADSVFANGALAGTGWYCVYNGKAGHVNIRGLKEGNTYTASIVEYRGVAGVQTYKVTGITTKVTTPVYPPVVKPFLLVHPAERPNIATSFQISVQVFSPVYKGVAVFVKQLGYRNGVKDTATYNAEFPGLKNMVYNANTKFGAGSQIDNSGWFCVYTGTREKPGEQPVVTGLRPITNYVVVAVPFNGSVTDPVYGGATSFAAANWQTLTWDKPTGYATGLTFSNTTSASTTLSWVNGTGSARAVFIKVGSMGALEPWLLDAHLYDPANPFTQGTPINDGTGNTQWYCVYNGTGSSVNLTGLSPSTTYRVAVIDHNHDNSPIPIAYVQRFNSANVTTLPLPGAPTVPPTGYAIGLTFSNTAATTTTLSWTNSNGSARAVFLQAGTSGALNVLQGQTYAANSTFKLGAQAGTNGWYCVYNGTGNNVNISGLAPSTTYRATVLEYNGPSGAEGYNLTRYNGASVTTLMAPAILLATNQQPMLMVQHDLSIKGEIEINVHQGMSPNGDGVNDVFTIDGIDAYPQNTVKIINGNGEVIYQAKGYDNRLQAFDGHAANGTMQRAGTYFYSLEYIKDGETITKTGYLVIKY